MWLRRGMRELLWFLYSYGWKLIDLVSFVCHFMQERYRVDCNMAVQLLQCKPSNFVAHKLNTVSIKLPTQPLKIHHSLMHNKRLIFSSFHWIFKSVWRVTWPSRKSQIWKTHARTHLNLRWYVSQCPPFPRPPWSTQSTNRLHLLSLSGARQKQWTLTSLPKSLATLILDARNIASSSVQSAVLIGHSQKKAHKLQVTWTLPRVGAVMTLLLLGLVPTQASSRQILITTSIHITLECIDLDWIPLRPRYKSSYGWQCVVLQLWIIYVDELPLGHSWVLTQWCLLFAGNFLLPELLLFQYFGVTVFA